MRALALALSLLLGCGGAASEAAGLRQLRLARASHEDVVKNAPDLFQRFEAAQQQVIAAKPESPERRDHESEARLWLEAAIAESERVNLAASRLAIEQETAQLEALALEHDRVRENLAAQAELEAARQIVRHEEELALSRAALAPQHRIKLGQAEVEQAAQAVIARATLVQLALASYELSQAQLAPLEAKLSRARAALSKSPDEALNLADQSLYASLALLGSMRGSEGVASEVERASLAEALTQSGASFSRNNRGLAVVLEKPFVGVRLQPGAQRLLSHLCSLTQGHPRGPVQLSLSSTPLSLADSRVGALREQLARFGCEGPRYQVARIDGAAAVSSDQLELTWLAY